MKGRKSILALKVLIVLFAIINFVKWTSNFGLADYHPLDFNTYYTAALCYFEGKNPYDSVARSSTAGLINEKNIVSTDVHSTVVYAPQFVYLFKLFLLTDNYSVSKYLQLTLNVVCLISLVLLCRLLSPGLGYLWPSITLLAFRGTWFALDNGQPMLLILTCILISIYLEKRRKNSLLPGLILGFFAFKFTLLVAPLAYFFLRKSYSTIAVALSTSVVLNALSLGLSPVPASEIVHSWTDNMQSIWQYTHVRHAFNGLNIINCSTSSALAYFDCMGDTAIKALYSTLFAAASLFFLYKMKRKDSDNYRPLLAFTLIGLAFSQHLFYDILVLLVFALINFRFNESLPLNVWITFAVVFLPLGKISEISGITELNFAVGLALLDNLSALAQSYLSKSNKAMKKAS